MKIKKFPIFFGPDDEGGGSSISDILGGVENNDGGEGAGEENGEGEGESKGEGEGEGAGENTPPPTKAPAAPMLDAAAFAKQFGDVLGGHLKEVQAASAPKPAPLTPEEAKKLLNVWEPDEEFLKEFSNVETQKQAFAKLRDALFKQMWTAHQMDKMEQQKQWEERFNPIQSLIEQQNTAAREQRFTSTYPQLAAEKLRPLLGSVAQELHKNGKLTGSESENFKMVAEAVAEVVKQVNPTFKLETTSSKSSASGTRPGGIAATTHGNGGGSGGTQGAGASTGSKLATLLGNVGAK